LENAVRMNMLNIGWAWIVTDGVTVMVGKEEGEI
jgi:hypothetical protein